MNKVQYKYRVRTEHCTIVLTYFVEQLRTIEIERNESYLELIALFGDLKQTRSETIESLKEVAKVRELKVNTTNQKIALWCELYKQRYGYNYKVLPSEANLMKNTDVTVDLINLFFDLQEWWSKEKTLTRYAKNINEIKRIFAGKAKQTTGTNYRAPQQNRADLAKEFERRFGNSK